MVLDRKLKHGDRVRYRRTRTGPVEADFRWTEWKEGTLNIQYRDKDLPKAHRRFYTYWQAGQPYAVNIDGMFDWAEYGMEDFGDDSDNPDQLLAEDYLLQIEPL